MSGASATDRAIEKLPTVLRGRLETYAEKLSSVAGECFSGLTVFGAVMSPEFRDRDIRVSNVLVLTRVELGVVKQIAERGSAFAGYGVAAPLIMTRSYIESSLDTFPLELIEISQRRETILGEDHFDALAFDESDVRYQCERELKTIQLRMRQGLLASAGREELLAELEGDVGVHLLRTLRGLIWLNGRREWLPIDDVVREASAMTNIDLGGVSTAMKSTVGHGWKEFVTLYEEVEALSRFVDAHA